MNDKSMRASVSGFLMEQISLMEKIDELYTTSPDMDEFDQYAAESNRRRLKRARLKLEGRCPECERITDEIDLVLRYKQSPPIVRAAIDAILELEERVDPMGYDIAYYQEDLPKVVTAAIAGWREKPRVLNKTNDRIPSDAVYVGRPTKWGNPFVIGRDGTRQQVIDKYRVWVQQQSHLIADLHQLHGHDLVCYCAPAACHADVLLELANE